MSGPRAIANVKYGMREYGARFVFTWTCVRMNVMQRIPKNCRADEINDSFQYIYFFLPLRSICVFSAHQQKLAYTQQNKGPHI